MAFPTLGSFPVAAGWPDRHGLQIATIWSKQVAALFREKTILSSISTSKYEGEIKNKGDNLIIPKEMDVTIREYVEGQPLVYENPEGETITLTVDKADYWGVKRGIVEKSMMYMDWMPKWAVTAADKLKIRVDRRVLAWLPAQVSALNQGIVAGKDSASVNLGAIGATVGITKLNAVDVIAVCEQVLDEQNALDVGRYIVIPPPFNTRLVTSELKNVYVTGDSQSPLRNGRLGDILKFQVLKSNLMSHAPDGSGVEAWNVLFGWSEALAFAQTITETNVIENAESFFGSLMRGLQVYGYKVTNPELIGNLYCNFEGAVVGS